MKKHLKDTHNNKKVKVDNGKLGLSDIKSSFFCSEWEWNEGRPRCDKQCKECKEQLESNLKYEIDLSRKLKKEIKRIKDDLIKCQERMVEYNRELNKSK